MLDDYHDALLDIGCKLEDLYEHEAEINSGNGGLGRFAACFIDSMATLELPSWAYGIRYHYGSYS